MKKLILIVTCFVNIITLIAQETEPILPEEESIQVPFNIIDEVPVFPGCEDSNDKRKCFQEMIQKHISENIQYPEEAQQKNKKGVVSTIFIVEKDGTISTIQTHGRHKILEEEARRILNVLPHMKPGKQRGKLVRVPFSVPITFNIK